jgi:hypothetical protein
LARYNRVVQNIERCFRIHQETDHVKELTFHAIRDWLNSNTKDGVTTAGLANLLRRRPQFRRMRTERKDGSNVTTSFWAMTENLPEGAEVRTGWVEINTPKDQIA